MNNINRTNIILSNNDCDSIIKAVIEAGRFVRSARDTERGIIIKPGDDNLATYWDEKTQEQLINRLLEIRPDAKFLAEEDGLDSIAQQPAKSGSENGILRFIIDPIDGTTNFIHNCMYSAISVAAAVSGEPVFGCVYNPYLDELFYAVKDGGAYMMHNDGSTCKKISVSSHTLADSLVVFGTSPYDKTTSKKTFSLAEGFFHACRDIRRSGSAALDICSVACGRCGAYFELLLSPWDFAAAALILKEAGGSFIGFDGLEITDFEHKTSALATNAVAYNDALAVVKAAL